MMKNDNLIQLEESMPSVRQQMLKEQLSNLYRQPARENAIRGSQIHRGSAAGIVTLLQQRGTASASSQTSTRPLSAAQPAAHSHWAVSTIYTALTLSCVMSRREKAPLVRKPANIFTYRLPLSFTHIPYCSEFKSELEQKKYYCLVVFFFFLIE